MHISHHQPKQPTSGCCRVAVQVVNCVGLVNYKFFLQFLLYTFVATLVAIACLIQPMLVFFSGTPAASGR